MWFLILGLLATSCLLLAILNKSSSKIVALESQISQLQSSLRLIEQQVIGFEEARIKQINQFHLEKERALREQRAQLDIQYSHDKDQALRKSRQVLRGRTYEQFAPWMIQGIHPHDYRWMGGPIDYVAFQGAEDIRSGLTSDLANVVLIEIKSGMARPNKVQQAIRRAVEEGRVRYQTIQLEVPDVTEHDSSAGSDDPTGTDRK